MVLPWTHITACMPVIAALGRQMQKYQVIPGCISSVVVSLAYMRLCLQFFFKKINFFLFFLVGILESLYVYKSDNISVV